MFDLDLWREIFQSINKNRTRSLLSGFTVAFAILLFAILFGMANGLQNTFKEQFGDNVANAVFIYPWTTSKAYKGLQAGRRIQFKNEDFEYIKSEFGDKIEYITSKINRSANASFRTEKETYPLTAIYPDNLHLDKTIITEGRFINQRDIAEKAKVVVIGKLVEEDLFINTDPLGKFINLNGIQYRVVGVFRDDDGDRAERVIYMPLATAQYIYGNNDYVDQIILTYNPKMNYDEAIAFCDDLKKRLQERFTVDPSDQRAIYVNNFADDFKNFNQMTLVISILIFVIGFGTLIAGIVGISNIMIFIVKERTKEIGIRKALGATPKSIVSIILIESVLITTIAGYLGLVSGMGILELATPILETYFIKNPSVSRSLVLGATITLIVAGGIAGYFPARKASNIKPIVALRND
jgi:putative ABC transport system permease protein